MSPSSFRQLALALPDTAESAHMGHPDFRVKGKIFASLNSPKPDWAMVRLTPDQQERFLALADSEEIAKPAAGAWGRQGCTHVYLGKGGLDRSTLRRAIVTAWRNTAPKRMVEELGPRTPPSL